LSTALSFLSYPFFGVVGRTVYPLFLDTLNLIPLPLVMIFPVLFVWFCIVSAYSSSISFFGYSSANSNTTSSSSEDDEDYDEEDFFRLLSLSSGAAAAYN